MERDHDDDDARTHAAFAVLRRRVVRAANDFTARLMRRVERNAVNQRTEDPGYGPLVRSALVELTNFLTGLVAEDTRSSHREKSERRDE